MLRLQERYIYGTLINRNRQAPYLRLLKSELFICCNLLRDVHEENDWALCNFMPQVASRFTLGKLFVQVRRNLQAKGYDDMRIPEENTGQFRFSTLVLCQSGLEPYDLYWRNCLSRYISFYNRVYVSCINFRCYAGSLFEDKSQRVSRGNRSVCASGNECVGVTKKKRKP